MRSINLHSHAHIDKCHQNQVNIPNRTNWNFNSANSEKTHYSHVHARKKNIHTQTHTHTRFGITRSGEWRTSLAFSKLAHKHTHSLARTCTPELEISSNSTFILAHFANSFQWQNFERILNHLKGSFYSQDNWYVLELNIQKVHSSLIEFTVKPLTQFPISLLYVFCCCWCYLLMQYVCSLAIAASTD